MTKGFINIFVRDGVEYFRVNWWTRKGYSSCTCLSMGEAALLIDQLGGEWL